MLFAYGKSYDKVEDMFEMSQTGARQSYLCFIDDPIDRFWEYVLKSTDRGKLQTHTSNQLSTQVSGVCGDLEWLASGMEELYCGLGWAVKGKEKKHLFF